MSSPVDTIVATIEALSIRNGLPPEFFRTRMTAILGDLPDAHQAARNCLRFLESGFTASLLSDFHAQPVLMEILLELVGQSQYLADILARNPELLRWLTTTGELRRTKLRDEYVLEATSAVALFERTERKLDSLKRVHRRELLRVGARDILKEADVTTITGELSALADAIVMAVTDIAHRDLNGRLETDLLNKMAVIALGKLGGGELNFSSDIDLLFVYDEDSDFSEPIGRLNNRHEYFVRLAESIVSTLTGFTPEGHLYRVDMRLRPYGRSGPLAMSRAAMRSYYETHGADWERQMLIKARPIAGDLAIGEQFLADRVPFVFPRTILRSPWKSITSMKDAIEKESGDESNIKLGTGGIRDIEFIVQGHQLLHGGNTPDVRKGHTLNALLALSDHGIIDKEAHRSLRRAYELFRVIEHRLQLFHGRQTHQLPETVAERQLLARKLGYQSIREFDKSVSEYRLFVRKQFTRFTSSDEKSSVNTAGRNELWDQVVSSLPHLKPSVREGIAQRIVNLSQEPSVQRTVAQMTSHPATRSLLVSIAHGSTVILERLRSRPLLIDSLAGSGNILLGSPKPGWDFLFKENPPEYHLFNETRTCIRFLADITTVDGVSRELSAVATNILERACDDLWRRLKHRQPPNGFVLVAVGKFGSGELSIWSDLDLIAIHDGKLLSFRAAEAFIHDLVSTVSRPEGPYALDFRLRPEGKNAPLVSSAEFFASYLDSRAEVWELMSLTRARLVWGDAAFWNRTTAIIRRRMKHVDVPVGWYIKDMRARMENERTTSGRIDVKLMKGGMADVEFLSQAAAVRRGSLNPIPVTKSIPLLVKERLISSSEAEYLVQSWRLYRKAELLIRLNSPGATSTLPDDRVMMDFISSGAGFSSAVGMVKEIRSSLRKTRTIFNASAKLLNKTSVRR